VQNHGGPLDLGSRSNTRAALTAAPTPTGAGVEPDLSRLGLNLIHAVQPASEADVLIRAELGAARYPLLLDAAKSGYNVVTADTTWKWALHPEPAVRAQYVAFWSAVLRHCLGEPSDTDGLKIEFEPVPGAPARTRVHVRRHPAVAPRLLRGVALEIDGPAGRRQVEPAPAAPAYAYLYAHRPEQPYVAWFRAHATTDDATVHSPRTPLLVQPDMLEFQRPMPQPELLKALTAAHPERYAAAPTAGDVIEELLEFSVGAAEPPRRTRRDTPREAALAGCLLLLLSVEWWLERRCSTAAGLT